jgi:hypothetical protein
MFMQSLYSIVLAIKYRATRIATLAGVGIAFTKFKNVFMLFPLYIGFDYVKSVWQISIKKSFTKNSCAHRDKV